jgi:uncharacterized damage-inducible protein DinB
MLSMGKEFLDESRSFLLADFFPKIERCLEQLTDDDVWWRPTGQANSIGNLLLHLDGSTRMWILAVAGGRQIERDRQREFDERSPIPRAELLVRLRTTLAEVDEVLSRLDPQLLLERRTQGGREVAIMWAIAHAVEHFSMHTGQIILLTKLRAREPIDLSG